MPPIFCQCIWFALLLASSFALSAATPTAADRGLSEYFEAETARLQRACLSEINTLADWEQSKGQYRSQLRQMLGLEPLPPRTDLKPVITGKLEHQDFTVEKLHFQAMPRVYVTANLYLPKHLSGPAPTILYVCGHARVVTNGVSCGNKAGYQHHGAWFARNGYVCLLIDTLQLGEIEGKHHGTYRENLWWWNSRGYTPAGVEAWFGIRALDYLCSRPEVDKERIGMTGRSGGGSYTWNVAALDDRVKVAAPVAGVTDLRNQVVDGVVEGHCDCMFYLNSKRWDFPQAAALIAPRPLLIANSDKDTIFPLDGVVRLHNAVRRIYALHGKANQLGLLITEGPHADTQDLQVPVFRWFNRFLKGEQPLIEMAATRFFEPLQLRVFDKFPQDELNTTLDRNFVPPASSPPANAEELKRVLRRDVFAGWPAGDPMVTPSQISETREGDVRQLSFLLPVQEGVVLPLYLVADGRSERIETLTLQIIDCESYTNSPLKELWTRADQEKIPARLREGLKRGAAQGYLIPRAVAPASWMNEPRKAAHVRRRFMLLGQTVDSMRVWDIRCALAALRGLPELKNTRVVLSASGPMAVNAAYAALFEYPKPQLELERLPSSHMDGPDYLNVLRVCDIPAVMAVLRKP